ncbi:Uncharacterised protein [Vibrio cholerae]|uniref:Uncharacterized protein n=1 Tax=Vibrio cholerae TaxID=666 RepID=A0A655YFU1_VIBCL|nr:Uncharacterised protein [Vibrio cholerae]CSB33761.1 Uncharacterised protein [Vibrio cholerae]CSB50594.1 Uncharacterised protein [Vibrio cholerae]CSB75542.1 Uncharacterised protein [Vibrio cholerae]CSC19711.1 Uncharacterised protein [Vibrio cholerae]
MLHLLSEHKQNFITNHVSEVIIDRFKMVNIQHRDPEFVILFCRGIDGKGVAQSVF